jgi:hypothetical protein
VLKRFNGEQPKAATGMVLVLVGFLTIVEVFDGFGRVGRFDRFNSQCHRNCFICFARITVEGTTYYPKFSFHSTKYAALRPDVLGSSLPEKF